MRILVCALTFLLVASSFGESLADQLVGHWQANYEDLLSDYVIRNDGTFTGYLAYKGTIVWKNAGKWKLRGKTVETELTQSSVAQVPVGTKDKNVVLEVTPTSIRLQVPDGSVRRYLRR